jgi:hypothetical protein
VAGAIQLTEVDFEQIKENLVDYLKSTNKFTDFDFDGSNLQVILDLLAYQAQINAYSTNMIANESFLASASIRQNVVSNAEMIGYNPTSARASISYVTFEFQLDRNNYTSGFPSSLEIQRGAAFSVTNNSRQLIFNFADPQTAIVSNFGVCTFTNTVISEGVFLSAQFTVDESDYNQRFILNNPNIDATTLRVEVQENPNEEINSLYSVAQNLVQLDENSKSYWLSETEEGYYELTFGDGFFGNKLTNGARIYVDYIATNGELGNGIQGTNNFRFIGKVLDSFGNSVSASPSVFSSDKTSGGQDIESVPSIKFRAPKFYETQNRCVVAEDYTTIIRKIYPAVDDIYVYGGEQKTIPQYGRIFIVVKPNYADKLSSVVKNFIKRSLNNYRIASLDLVFEDPQVLNVELVSTVYYDSTQTLKDSGAIASTVRETLNKYADSPNVERFGGSVRYSRLIGSIDDSDASIIRNLTEVRMRRDLQIVPNTVASYEICFENELPRDPLNSVVYSTGFKMVMDGVIDDKTYYFRDINDMDNINMGRIVLFYFGENLEEVIANENFGTVDYEKGEVLIGYQKPIKVYDTEISDYNIQVRALPKEVDVTTKKSMYLNLDVASSVINVIENRGV